MIFFEGYEDDLYGLVIQLLKEIVPDMFDAQSFRSVNSTTEWPSCLVKIPGFERKSLHENS